MMETSTLRIQRHLEQLAEFTATPGQGTTRMSYSEQDKQARDYIKQQMRALGLQVREDAIGNIYGRLEGSEEGLPAVIIGSHFDSVPHGGAFDGPAGIVTGLDVVARIREQQLQPRYPLGSDRISRRGRNEFWSWLDGIKCHYWAYRNSNAISTER